MKDIVYRYECVYELGDRYIYEKVSNNLVFNDLLHVYSYGQLLLITHNMNIEETIYLRLIESFADQYWGDYLEFRPTRFQ